MARKRANDQSLNPHRKRRILDHKTRHLEDSASATVDYCHRNESALGYDHLHRTCIWKAHAHPALGRSDGSYIGCQCVAAWTQRCPEASLRVRLNRGDVSPVLRAHTDARLIRIGHAKTSCGESVATIAYDRLAANTREVKASEATSTGRPCNARLLSKSQGSDTEREAKEGEIFDSHTVLFL